MRQALVSHQGLVLLGLRGGVGSSASGGDLGPDLRIIFLGLNPFGFLSDGGRRTIWIGSRFLCRMMLSSR